MHSHTTKRRLKKSHAFVVGTGLVASSMLLASSTKELGIFSKSVDLSISRAEYQSDGSFSYVIENAGPSTTKNLTVKFDWLDVRGEAVSSSFATAPITIGAGTPQLNVGIAAVQQFDATKYFFTTPSAAAQKLRITLDPENVITETREENNVKEIPITANIRLTNVAIAPDGNLSLTVQNDGPATVSAFRITAEQVTGRDAVAVGSPFSVDVTTPLPPLQALTYTAKEPIGAALNEYVHQYQYGVRAVHIQLVALGVVRQISQQKEDVDVMASYPMPKLEITDASYVPGSDFQFTIKNTGVWSADQPELELAWVNAKNTIQTCTDGIPACVGFTPNSILRPGEHLVFTQQATSSFLQQRPKNASALSLTVRAGNGQESVNPPAPITVLLPR